VTPHWLTVFVDLAPEEHDEATALWQAITGYRLSAARGEAGEFATLVPPDGDAHLRTQRLDDGASGTHLDLHVADLDAAVEEAIALGATLVARPGHAILRSPGGYPFCLVTGAASRPAAPTGWPDGHRSRVDQLCLDIVPAAYDRECDFWASLTGWPVRPSSSREFRRLAVPTELGVRLLLQRREYGDGPVTGHLDVATDDRAAEVARLAGLGLEPAGEGAEWTVLRPPVGPVLCVTDRGPDGGMLG